ncbi:hypothetical protein K474DRAFT_1708659 [Panus rudis PR-1116 ss-1]|nr:hypothetical protein K474DRAFT_1708659 [Panus rudis PR-1116 ss-1]
MGKGRGGNSNRGSRGGFRGQARGRGGFGPQRGGRGRGRGGYVPLDDFDFPVQMYQDNHNSPRGRGNNTSGRNTPRGRGRGNLGFRSSYDDYSGIGRGSPTDTPRGGRGGRNLPSKLRAGAPLSRLLYEDRPYLKPVVFVRSVYTATLFQQEEEILKPVADQEIGDDEKSHVPTADAISRIFGSEQPDAEEELSGEEEQDEEQLEEIDFSEIGRVQAEVDAAYARQTAGSTIASEANKVSAPALEEKFTGFFIDTTPGPVSDQTTTVGNNALGDALDDEEVIVYVAPHPRAGPVTPPPEPADSPPAALLPKTSILSGISITTPSVLEAMTTEPKPTDTKDVVASGTPTNVVPDQAQTTGADSAATSVEPAPTAIEDKLRVETSATEASISVKAKETATATSSTAPSAPAPSSSKPTSTTNADENPTFFSLLASSPYKKQTRKVHPTHTPRSLLDKSRKLRSNTRARYGLKRGGGFGSFGAMLSERQLRAGREVDPRKNEQRRGDSDIDWGDEDSDEDTSARGYSTGIIGLNDEDDDIDKISTGVGDMELDGDVDLKAMQRFVNSMRAEGSRFVTMDDIADTEKMRKEDEEEAVRAKSQNEEDEEDDEESEEDEEERHLDDEMEAVLSLEERLLIAEEVGIKVPSDSDEDDEEDEVSSDEGDSPRASFQARLDRIRAQSRSNGKGKGKARAVEESDEEDDRDDYDNFEMSLERSWADDDEEFIAHIQSFVDENQEILSRRDRKQRNKVFNAIRDGRWDMDEYEEMMGKPAGKRKDVNRIPPELREQWAKDREKKADNKRKRALLRLEAAADPLAPKKGGKKGMKATITAARLAANGELASKNQVINFTTLEAQIRRFLADVGGKETMALPPADKATRAKIHELATAFKLKSQSKGQGASRYTTLIKTTSSGIGVNERKVRRIVRSMNPDWEGPRGNGTGRSKVMSLAKHKEGEEVGKAAPKINESNIGFKLLASMGWSEGDRIGLSGGLEAPLTAVMKKTKLGLGATAVNL